MNDSADLFAVYERLAERERAAHSMSHAFFNRLLAQVMRDRAELDEQNAVSRCC